MRNCFLPAAISFWYSDSIKALLGQNRRLSTYPLLILIVFAENGSKSWDKQADPRLIFTIFSPESVM